MINLEWFRTFKTIYEMGSMTAAAEALCISQPGVSLHLSSLENHMGHQLFERQPRKLLPTERGKLLYNAIIDPIECLEEVETKFQRSSGGDVPSITVGMCFETFQLSLEKHISDLPFNLILEFGEYGSLLTKLEQGVVDIVVTPHCNESKGIEYTPFSQENIILIAGRETDSSEFDALLERGDREEATAWLKSMKWYGITGDNEHLRRFWLQNFDSHPNFRPNYIVPNIHSILRCICDSEGLAVVPDFLCLDEIESGAVHVVWKGFKPLTNTLYFARRKKSLHRRQLDVIEEIVRKEMPNV